MLAKHLKQSQPAIKMNKHTRLTNLAVKEVSALKIFNKHESKLNLLADFAVAMFVSGFIQNLRVNGDYLNLKSYDVVLFSITEMLKNGDLTTLHIDNLMSALKEGIYNTDGSNLLEDLLTARALFILANDGVYVNSLEDSAAILADNKIPFLMFTPTDDIFDALTQLEAVKYHLRALPLKMLSSKYRSS